MVGMGLYRFQKTLRTLVPDLATQQHHCMTPVVERLVVVSLSQSNLANHIMSPSPYGKLIISNISVKMTIKRLAKSISNDMIRPLIASLQHVAEACYAAALLGGEPITRHNSCTSSSRSSPTSQRAFMLAKLDSDWCSTAPCVRAFRNVPAHRHFNGTGSSTFCTRN
jgi:hypothetical protein